jgi:alginate O-acetyltransferase complex protein AlgI
MLFVELAFLPFFLVVFVGHWLLASQRVRKVWLLAASAFFYGAWDWRFLGLLAFSTLLDFGVGLGLERPGAPRRALLGLSLAGNLGLLGFFKYFGFFVDSAVACLGALGVEAHRPTLAIVLPVGISFYTFQTLSYALDIYGGKLRASRSLLDFALFVTFFPQLVAGPIVRAADFLPQLGLRRAFRDVDVRGALLLFGIGFFKKACVSDMLAPYVDRYFAAPESFQAFSAWIAVPAYAVQIYCDFSGYSEMAIASAALLGYELCPNFARPYFARNLTEFWRRWHISLSTWLRDYLYVPLGGNRRGRVRTYVNLLATMLLGGLWHGAAWNFVIWGGLHGLALAALRIWSELRPSRPRPRSMLATALATVATFWFVCVAWIFFRAQGTAQALDVLASFVLGSGSGTGNLGASLAVLLACLALLHGAAARFGARCRTWVLGLPTPAFALGSGVAGALLLLFVPPEARPFIYFQF